MDDWDPAFLAALATKRQVITFDNRGIGSSSTNGPYPFTQLADDVAVLIPALGLERADVLGWSMGAMIELDLTIRYPELVTSYVLHAGDMGGPESIPPLNDVLATLTDVSGTEADVIERTIALMLPPEWVAANRNYVDMIFYRARPPVSRQGFDQQGMAFNTSIRARWPRSWRPFLRRHTLAEGRSAL